MSRSSGTAVAGVRTTPPARRDALSVPVVLLAVVDLLLLAANVAHRSANEPSEERTVLSGWRWSGELDGSYVEIWGYVQLSTAVVVLALTAVRARSVVLGGWALVLGCVVADDALQLHERGGAVLVRALDLQPAAGLRAADLGELTFWALGAALLGAALLAAHLRSAGEQRRRSRTLARLLATLAVFAVAVDMLHIAVSGRVPELVKTTIGLVETAGELGVMTALLLVVSRSATARRGPPGSP